MKRRVAFLISDQHLIPHGGIGQFAKGFCEMAESNDCVVDLILDNEPRNAFFKHNGLTITPDNPQSLKDHRAAFAFKDSYSLERATNFRNATMKALQSNLYDLIVLNTPEALLGVYGLDLSQHIPTVFYTHNENLVFRNEAFKGVFNQTFDAFFAALMRADHLIIGTQTDRNKQELGAAQCNAITLPMPMPERELLKAYEGKKSGLLFIGRWEDRKNYKEFLRVAGQVNLPIKVMTAANSVEKWQAALDKINVQHDVRGGITGQEKVDFIRSSKVFYMPSKSESYGFSLLEAAGHCHCVVLDGYGWTDNWDDSLFYKTSPKLAHDLIATLNNRDVPVSQLATVRSIDQNTWKPWQSIFDNFIKQNSMSDAAKINTWQSGTVKAFIKTLGRFASSEDVISILNNRHKFNISYSTTDTMLAHL